MGIKYSCGLKGCRHQKTLRDGDAWGLLPEGWCIVGSDTPFQYVACPDHGTEIKAVHEQRVNSGLEKLCVGDYCSVDMGSHKELGRYVGDGNALSVDRASNSRLGYIGKAELLTDKCARVFKKGLVLPDKNFYAIVEEYRRPAPEKDSVLGTFVEYVSGCNERIDAENYSREEVHDTLCHLEEFKEYEKLRTVDCEKAVVLLDMIRDRNRSCEVMKKVQIIAKSMRDARANILKSPICGYEAAKVEFHLREVCNAAAMFISRHCR